MEHQPKYPKYSESQGQVQWTVRMMVRPDDGPSADEHRKWKIITNDENSEFTGIYTIKKMQKTLAQVQLWDAKSLLRVVMWPGAHFFFKNYSSLE